MPTTHYHGFCTSCQTGSAKSSERAAQQWSDTHNRVKHQGAVYATAIVWTTR